MWGRGGWLWGGGGFSRLEFYTRRPLTGLLAGSSALMRFACTFIFYQTALIPSFRAISTMADPGPPAGSPATVRPPDDLCDMAFSCEIMEDPVVAADGYTYNRSEITTWFAQHNVLLAFQTSHACTYLRSHNPLILLNVLKLLLRHRPKQVKFYRTKCSFQTWICAPG